jgi:hypothetical protein
VGLSRTGEVRHALIDIAAVIRDLSRRPTHVSELVQGSLVHTGYCDASAFGAGGVWFGGETDMEPIVWRIEWPPDLTKAVVSDQNPSGTLTNSDLEMAGVLLHEAVIEAHLGPAMQGPQIAIGCDNSPAVAWTTRMASRSASSIAFRLLKGLAMRQPVSRSAPPAIFHVAGVTNTLADVASCALTGVATHFHILDLSPTDMCPNTFLTLFDSMHPLPQTRPWRNVQPPSGLWFSVISTLRGQRLALRQWTTKLDLPPGPTGPTTPPKPKSIPIFGTSRGHSNKPISSHLPPGFELGSSGTRSKLEPSLWKRPCVAWRKPSFWPDSTTPDARMDPKN